MAELREFDNLAGVLASSGGGGGGSDDYGDLSNKPQINDNTLVGNKTSTQLKLDNIPSGNTLPSGSYVGQMFVLLQDTELNKKGIYRYDGTDWNMLPLGVSEQQIIIELTGTSGTVADDDIELITDQEKNVIIINGSDIYRLANVASNIFTFRNTSIVTEDDITNNTITINADEDDANYKAWSKLENKYELTAEMLDELIDAEDDIRVDLSDDDLTLIIGTHAKIVSITGVPPTAEAGTLTEEQVSALEESTNSYIVFNNEIYKLNDNGHEAGTKGYSHIGVENGVFMLKNITVTLNTRGWVLTTEEVVEPELENAYDSLETMGDIDNSYLAYTEYSGLDYGYAKDYFADLDTVPNFGACSSVVRDGVLARNYDWKYSEDCEFVVRTPAINNRHAVIGTVGQVSGLTKDFVKSKAYSEKYKLVPFMLVDGKNDAGLKMNINVVPNDNGDTTGTLDGGEEVNALMFIRWALDYCSTVQSVVSATQNKVSIVVPQALRDMGYEVHFMVSDKTETKVLEFVNNECVWTTHDKMTNFFIDGVTFKTDGTVPVIGDSDILTHGLTNNAEGLERYNIIVNGDSLSLEELVEKLKYTKLYTLDEDKWYSELCGFEELDIGYPISAFEPVMTEVRGQYATRTRDGVTDQTVHSVIYGNDTMKIFTQEDYTSAFTFELPKQEGGEPDAYLKSIEKDATNKTITITDKQGNETEFDYGIKEILKSEVDVTTITETGFYRLEDCSGLPTSTSRGELIVIRSNESGSCISQIYTYIDENEKHIYFRGSRYDEFYEWVELAYNTDVLKIISQADESLSGSAENQYDVNAELVSAIKFIQSKPDVSDIVQCYDRGTDASKTDIAHYDLTTLLVNDIVKVLIDETHDNKVSYYKLVQSGSTKSLSYLGSDKPIGVDNITIEKDTTTGNLQVKDEGILFDKINSSMVADEISSSPSDEKFPTEEAVADELKKKIEFKSISGESGTITADEVNKLSDNTILLLWEDIQMIKFSEDSGGIYYTGISRDNISLETVEINKSTGAWTHTTVMDIGEKPVIYSISGTSGGISATQRLRLLNKPETILFLRSNRIYRYIERNGNVFRYSDENNEIIVAGDSSLWQLVSNNKTKNKIDDITYATREALLTDADIGTTNYFTKFTTASENPDGTTSSQKWNIVVYKENTASCQMIAYLSGSDKIYHCYRESSGWSSWKKQDKLIETALKSNMTRANLFALLGNGETLFVKGTFTAAESPSSSATDLYSVLIQRYNASYCLITAFNHTLNTIYQSYTKNGTSWLSWNKQLDANDIIILINETSGNDKPAGGKAVYDYAVPRANTVVSATSLDDIFVKAFLNSASEREGIVYFYNTTSGVLPDSKTAGYGLLYQKSTNERMIIFIDPATGNYKQNIKNTSWGGWTDPLGKFVEYGILENKTRKQIFDDIPSSTVKTYYSVKFTSGEVPGGATATTTFTVKVAKNASGTYGTMIAENQGTNDVYSCTLVANAPTNWVKFLMPSDISTTIKTALTGSIASGNTNFATGGDVYIALGNKQDKVETNIFEFEYTNGLTSLEKTIKGGE